MASTARATVCGKCSRESGGHPRSCAKARAKAVLERPTSLCRSCPGGVARKPAASRSREAKAR
eukprot:15480363-Alexandrium_andersonii.AAC.1